MSLPDETDVQRYVRIGVWLMACVLSGVLGAMIHALASSP